MVSRVNVVNVEHLLGTDVTERRIFSIVRLTSFCEHLQAIISGITPGTLDPLWPLELGLVFCSPLITGTRETSNQHEFSLPTLNWNCLRASMKGALSISPTVPPSSMIQTSGSIPVSSTGILETLSIHS